MGDSLETLVRAIVRDEITKIGRSTGALVATYSQHDGERPTGTKRQRYLDVHARAFAAGDPGATKIGRARLLTHDAWVRWATSLPSRVKPKAAPVLTADEQMLAELGLERAS